MIPKPKQIELFDEYFQLPYAVKVAYDETDELMDDLLMTFHRDAYTDLWVDAGYSRRGGTMQIEFRLKDVGLPHPEGYELRITKNKIECYATDVLGFHYAYQTLLQLFYLALNHDKGMLQVQTIRDWPSYPWRGMHLDISRHFYDDEEIIPYSSWMAALKMNQLHLHLSDDQGWRLELERFPELTEKGAWRRIDEYTMYGGYLDEFNLDEILGVLEELRINVVPEIDLPGHAMAILSAYPQYACFPRDFEPLSVWGISEDIICAGNDKAVAFLKELVLEVSDLFPGPYFHIGGDEAPKHRWKECPKCQKRIKDLGLKDEEALQGWLIRELQQTLEQAGKTIMGWDEILDTGVDEKPIISVWRGDGLDAAKLAVENGNRFVICPNQYLYFDWRATPGKKGPHGVTSLEKVMSLNPQDYCFGRPDLLLGGQANMWTEHTPEFSDVRRMIFPRIFAAAEIFWNGKAEPDLPERIARLQGAFK